MTSDQRQQFQKEEPLTAPLSPFAGIVPNKSRYWYQDIGEIDVTSATLKSPSSPRLLSLMIPTHDEATGKRLTPVERLTYAQRHMTAPAPAVSPPASDRRTMYSSENTSSPVDTKSPEPEECIEDEGSDSSKEEKDTHDHLNRSIVGEHGFERPDGFFGGGSSEEVPKLSPLSTPPRRSWTPKAELTISPDQIIRNPLDVDNDEIEESHEVERSSADCEIVEEDDDEGMNIGRVKEQTEILLVGPADEKPEEPEQQDYSRVVSSHEVDEITAEEKSIPERDQDEDDSEEQEQVEQRKENHECSTDKAGAGADKASPLHTEPISEVDQANTGNELPELNEVSAEVESVRLRHRGEGGDSESAEAEDQHDDESPTQALPSKDLELKHEDMIGGFLNELTADSVNQGGENSEAAEESASLTSSTEVSVQVAELAKAVKSNISECQAQESLHEKDLIVLFSLYPESLNNFQQMSNQRRATTILMARKIDTEFIDGSDPEQKERRNELFSISGKYAMYPQFFIKTHDGSIEYFGDFSELEELNDEGILCQVIQEAKGQSSS